MCELWSTINKIEDILLLKEAGATGIIVGENFHGTRLTTAFSLEDIQKIDEICFENNLKLLIKMNRIYIDGEFEKAKIYLNFLSTLHVHGIFFNDLGLYVIAKKMGQNMERKMIYDPDTIVTNHFDVNYHLDKGLLAVVLSKEITKEEMIMIASQAKGPTCVIVHGYLNMSYAKRKLISNYFEFLGKDYPAYEKRSLYLIEEHREGKMPIIEDDQGTMVFTDYVQESFDEILSLRDAGVQCFILDGIFLKSEPIIDAVKMYREILNGGDNLKSQYYEQYSDLSLSTGYMEKATNLVK